MEAKDAIMRIKDFGLYHAIEDLPNSTLTVEAFNKAIKLLRLEESGLLIKLPYPVGTPLFIPCRKQGVRQDHIRRWQTNNKGLMFCSNGSFYLADAIGKTVFLTREEAEEKLESER